MGGVAGSGGGRVRERWPVTARPVAQPCGGWAVAASPAAGSLVPPCSPSPPPPPVAPTPDTVESLLTPTPHSGADPGPLRNAPRAGAGGPRLAPGPAPFGAPPPPPLLPAHGAPPPWQTRGCPQAPPGKHRVHGMPWMRTHGVLRSSVCARPVPSPVTPRGQHFRRPPGWRGVHLQMSGELGGVVAVTPRVPGTQLHKKETFIRGFFMFQTAD